MRRSPITGIVRIYLEEEITLDFKWGLPIYFLDFPNKMSSSTYQLGDVSEWFFTYVKCPFGGGGRLKAVLFSLF